MCILCGYNTHVVLRQTINEWRYSIVITAYRRAYTLRISDLVLGYIGAKVYTTHCPLERYEVRSINWTLIFEPFEWNSWFPSAIAFLSIVTVYRIPRYYTNEKIKKKTTSFWDTAFVSVHRRINSRSNRFQPRESRTQSLSLDSDSQAPDPLPDAISPHTRTSLAPDWNKGKKKNLASTLSCASRYTYTHNLKAQRTVSFAHNTHTP